MSNECSICFSKSNSEEQFVTRCNHSFCNNCMLKWMLENDNCPMCRNILSFKNKDTINIYDENSNLPHFIVHINDDFDYHNEEFLNNIVDDFIETYLDLESHTNYNWKRNKNNAVSITLRKKNKHIIFRFKLYKNINKNKYHINIVTYDHYIKKYTDIKKPFISKNQLNHKQKYYLGLR